MLIYRLPPERSTLMKKLSILLLTLIFTLSLRLRRPGYPRQY